MNIDLFTYTNSGARPLNEDCFGTNNDNNRFVAVLCDGLGGHNCGEVASEMAVKNILEGISLIDTLDTYKINRVLKIVNDGIVNQQLLRPEQKGMRTTAVGCIIEKDELICFNCGDSRFYYFSDGALSIMSKDHSVPQMLVDMGEMTFDDIRFSPDRNKLLKVLGENMSDEVGSVYSPLKLKKGDAFLLCSDGFWEYILEEEMEIDLSKSNTAKEWIEFMLVRLLLKFSSSNDNFTVIGGIIN